MRMEITGGFGSDSLDPAGISDACMTLLSFGQLRNTLVERDEGASPDPSGRELGRVGRCRVVAFLAAAGGLSFTTAKPLMRVVKSVPDEVLVMDRGRIVERGPAAEVLTVPDTPVPGGSWPLFPSLTRRG